MPVVGFLRSETLTNVPPDRVTAFRQGLKEAGFGPERRDRNPLERGSKLAASGGGRSSPAGSRDRRQYPFGARGQGRNHDSADRLCDRR
jgi:hypothetical protein